MKPFVNARRYVRIGRPAVGYASRPLKRNMPSFMNGSDVNQPRLMNTAIHSGRIRKLRLTSSHLPP